MTSDRRKLGFLVAACALACANGAPSLDGGSSSPAAGSPASAAGAPAAGSNVGGAGGRPPEQENESRYLAPVVTGKYLWTANPLSGRVALIDGTSLRVRLESAGNGPRQVAALPEREGSFGALVLNELSDDATLFLLGASGEPVKRGPFRTHGDANAWAVSAGGQWAIAWTDVRLRPRADPLETFQDITVFSLERGLEAVWSLSIGARASAFAFSDDEGYAYAVTEEGISVIELGAEPRVVDLLAVTDDPLEDPATRDVGFAADGASAIVHTDGQRSLSIVPLPRGQRRTVELEAPITDVDLAPAGDRAFVVMASLRRVVVVPLDEAAADPSTFARATLPGSEIGAVALNADASAAVLYSTVLGATQISLIETAEIGDALASRSYDLIGPVSALFAAPDPRFAVAFQGQAVGSARAGAFSLLQFSGARVPYIVATDAAPAHIAFSAPGDRAVITVRSDERRTFGAYVATLATQRTDFVALASAPESAGVIPAAGRAYVAQSHPEGRITFISLTDGSAQTLAGFELSARILSD